jgi:hypothetical protein
MARPRFPLSPAAVAELERVWQRPPGGQRLSFRQLAAHLRARRLVTRRVDPRIVWRVIRALFPPPPEPQRRGTA